MAELAFSNFDVWIEPNGADYFARAAAPPWGEAGPQPFVLPFSPQELTFENFTSDTARAVGKKLFDALFADDLKSFYRTCAQLAANQNTGLRIRLRLKDLPALANAPWEFLHDGQDFLALSAQRAIVRYLESPQTIKPLTVTPPLRALVIFSNPRDYDELDTVREGQKLNDALADVVSAGLFEIELLEPPTLAALQEKLRSNAYHILHFGGHGEFDASASGAAHGALVFQNENGNGQRVSAIEFARYVRDHATLRLIVLNACQGARASTRDVFTGVAQTLMQNNIPAVIAMQNALTDNAAQIFSATLYGALADQYPIDAALGEARKALSQRNSLEWATPVLFTRADDGNLFTRTTMDENALRALKRAALLRAANAALDNADLARASEYASRLLSMDANDRTARELRERIQRKREVAEFFAQGKKYVEEGRWQDAVNALRQVQWRQVNYRETTMLLAHALRAATPTNAGTVAAPPSPLDEFEVHYKDIVREMLRGKIVPFFGQGSNLYGRARQERWQQGHGAPSGDELARYLAANFDYDEADSSDLIRVSQYVAVTRDNTALYDELHQIFDEPYAPTPLHRFWAELPAQLRARGPVEFYPIVVTANYDLLLEKAFQDQGEEFDSLIYLAEGQARGKFLHRTFKGEEYLVEDASSYSNMRLNERTTIVRIHGAVAPSESAYESFVITEDHFLDLFQTDVASLMPRTVAARLRESYVLFMGCNLRNWNLRGLLYRLAKTKYRPWLIQPQIRKVEQEYWRGLNVRVLDLAFDVFLLNLSARLQSTLNGGGQ